MRLRLGARGSALSRAQAELVSGSLPAGVAAELVVVKTTGDRLSAAGQPIGWKGDFTRELDEALLGDRIDFAVHSLKDVPSALAPGLVLAAVPLREDPRDVLISGNGLALSALAPGASIGTSSPRRRAQILAARPDLRVEEARGNIDTRLTRVREGRWDAVVLARAGLARLGRLNEVIEVFDDSVLLPAVAQGALGVVAREGDRAVLDALKGLDHAGSHAEVLAERGFLEGLSAGCRAPVAARAHAAGNGGNLRLKAAVFARDGSRMLRGEAEGNGDPGALGRDLAARLLSQGAAALIGEER